MLLDLCFANLVMHSESIWLKFRNINYIFLQSHFWHSLNFIDWLLPLHRIFTHKLWVITLNYYAICCIKNFFILAQVRNRCKSFADKESHWFRKRLNKDDHSSDCEFRWLFYYMFLLYFAFFCARIFGTWKNMPTCIKINWFLRLGFILPKSIINKSINRVFVNWFYINSVKTYTCGQYAIKEMPISKTVLINTARSIVLENILYLC